MSYIYIYIILCIYIYIYIYIYILGSACNLCIVSLYESGKQCWVQSLPPKCSVIGAGHGPSSNIYVANITILNSIT